VLEAGLRPQTYWREWARIEVEGGHGSEEAILVMNTRGIHSFTCKTGVPGPQMLTTTRRSFLLPGVKKLHHAGLIVRSNKLERVEGVVRSSMRAALRMDFVAVVPPLEKAE